ncbi:SPFH domain-containing protein [Leptolyngbya sp. FACHB-261]|uniref:SPFH domain-containing protein n=1 Tax=Leptolyngbya sp. FACHB-261 TaxID=2692806 RepID=UPI001688127F|nr:SPFH domain-containing protein [Leptolyngbya sp. FACHB-261]MBD2103221.1 SPFH/Band 7/PHB domain protein [Leptolyngbya sp. FACHB-261]
MGALMLLLIVIVLVAFYVTRSIKQIEQGNVVVVERLGRYSRTLQPGLNLMIPFFERIAVEYSMREQPLDVQPQQCLTADGISVMVDAIIFWRIIDPYRAYISVQELRPSLGSLVQAFLRSEIGEMDLKETFASRAEINRKLLKEVDSVTEGWGVKVTRVEIQEIKPPQQTLDAMAREVEARSLREATETEAKGNAEATRTEAKANAEAMNMIANELSRGNYSAAALQFLIAQNYLKTSGDLSQSPNAKVLFMDPNSLPGAVQGILSMLEGGKRGEPNDSPDSSNGKPNA